MLDKRLSVRIQPLCFNPVNNKPLNPPCELDNRPMSKRAPLSVRAACVYRGDLQTYSADSQKGAANH